MTRAKGVPNKTSINERWPFAVACADRNELEPPPVNAGPEFDWAGHLTRWGNVVKAREAACDELGGYCGLGSEYSTYRFATRTPAEEFQRRFGGEIIDHSITAKRDRLGWSHEEQIQEYERQLRQRRE